MSDSPQSNRPTPRTSAAIEAELRRRIRAELTQARSDAENGQVDDATLANIIASAIGAALGWHLESPEHARNATISSRTWRPAGGPRGSGRPDDEEADRGDRPPRGDFGDRPPRRDFGDRPPRRDFGDRPPRRDFGDRPPRRDFGDRPPRDVGGQGRDSGDRPRRDFGDRPPRGDFGDRPPRRDFGDRPPRDFSDRGPRPFGDRRPFDRAPRDAEDDRDGPPRRGGGRPPFSPRGGGGRPPNRGGGGFSRGGGFGPRRPPRPR